MSVLLSTTIFGAGCAATPEPIYVYETKTLYQDRYVAVPESLIQPVEVPALSADFDVYELGAVAKAREIRLLQCNGRLTEIAGLGDE